MLANMGLKADIQKKNSSRALQDFNRSRKYGKKYRVFLPLMWADGDCAIPTATHIVNRYLKSNKKLGIVRLKQGEDFEVAEDGSVKDLSILKDLRKYSSIFYDAEERVALESAEEEAKRLAERIHSDVDIQALKKKQQEIKEEFHGNDKEGDERVGAKHKRLIGKVEALVYTEAIMVPMDATGKLEVQEARHVILEFTKSMSETVESLVESHKPAEGTKFMELLYAYDIRPDEATCKRKATFDAVEASAASSVMDPVGFSSKELERLFNDMVPVPVAEDGTYETLEKLYREQYVPKLLGRHGVTNNHTTLVDVQNVFYSIVGSSDYRINLATIDLESDSVKRNAQLLINSKLFDTLGDIKTSLEALAAAEDAPTETVDTTDTQAAAAVNATSLSQIADIAGDMMATSSDGNTDSTEVNYSATPVSSIGDLADL